VSVAHEYRGRRAAVVENDELRVTVLEEGGHIAEILDKRSGINPILAAFVSKSLQAGPPSRLPFLAAER
jgi:hypothetical protein